MAEYQYEKGGGEEKKKGSFLLPTEFMSRKVDCATPDMEVKKRKKRKKEKSNKIWFINFAILET